MVSIESITVRLKIVGPDNHLFYLRQAAIPVLKWFFSRHDDLRGTGRSWACAQAIYKCASEDPDHNYEIRDHEKRVEGSSRFHQDFQSRLTEDQLRQVWSSHEGKIRSKSTNVKGYVEPAKEEMLEFFKNAAACALRAGVPLKKLQKALDEATIQETLTW